MLPMEGGREARSQWLQWELGSDAVSMLRLALPPLLLR